MIIQKIHTVIKLCMSIKLFRLILVNHYYCLQKLNVLFLIVNSIIVQILFKRILWHMSALANLKLLLLHFQQHQRWQLTIISNALGLKAVNNKVITLKLLLNVDLHPLLYQDCLHILQASLLELTLKYLLAILPQVIQYALYLLIKYVQVAVQGVLWQILQ